MLETNQQSLEYGFVKPKLKIESPVKHAHVEPKVPTIESEFFEGTSVIIKIDNKNLRKIVQTALQNVGAIVMSENPLLADYIISDEQVTIPNITLRSSRGAALLNAASISQNIPKLILLKQIPWVYDLIRGESPKKQQEQPILPMIVVSDGKYAPNYLELTLPTLHLGKVPHDYFICPFEPIALDINIEDYKRKPNPPQTPQSKIRKTWPDDMWKEFDKMSQELSKKFYSE